MSFFKKVESGFVNLTRSFFFIASFSTFILMCITVVDVIMRYVARKPIMGAPELSEFLMVISIFLVWGYCAAQRFHICVSLLTDKFPKKVQIITELFTLALTFSVFIVMARETIFEALHQKSVSTVLRIPRAPFYGVMALGVCLLVLAIVKLFIENVRALRRNVDES